jgi:hypothetical protein
VKGSEDGEGAGVESGRTAGDKGSCAVAALEHSHGGEEADSGAKAGTADLELACQFAFRRKAIAGFDLSRGDEGANMFDDLHGQLAVRGCVGDGLFFHCETDSCLGKWEKGNTEGRGTAKAQKIAEPVGLDSGRALEPCPKGVLSIRISRDEVVIDATRGGGKTEKSFFDRMTDPGESASKDMSGYVRSVRVLDLSSLRGG